MTSLAHLGEKEVVRRLINEISSTAAVGPGDDAAAIDMGDYYLVISTDLLSEKTHKPKEMTYRQFGWSVAAVNFSDIAAMGAKPIGILLSFGVPKRLRYENLREMMRGAMECCNLVGATILGGDTKETSEITVVGTAIGIVGKDEILLRKGAKLGDLVAVTGTLGLAAAGYFALKNGLRCAKCLKALFEPLPRVEEGLTLSSSGFVTSCIDISDGLAFSLKHLSEASGVSFQVEWEKIPVDSHVYKIAKASKINEEELVLYFGGDYQLLFTINPDGWRILEKRLNSKISVIGKVIDADENILIRNNTKVKLEDRGYEHFR
ncbi:MAG: thiamine-phosphate kinase [Methanomassiliicoccales archaeon]|jgi:thiamine-monophosphate kinase|nr:thiamine-phosphate kinase [Methanomassiliicoccales archaeon]